MRSLLLALFLLALAGCVTLPKDQCEKPNWEHIGRVDATEGFDADTFATHVRYCERTATVEDETLYLKGWRQGLEKFCTAQNGYTLGSVGTLKSYSCDPQKYPEFNQQLKLGRKVYALKQEQKSLDDRIKRQSEDQGFFNQLYRTTRLLKGEDPEGDLKDQSQDLTKQIGKLEVDAAGKTGDMYALSMQPSALTLRTTHYLGAMVGTVMGFGLGHAVQGRWHEEGWKFTLGEFLTLGTMVATAGGCENKLNPLTARYESHCEGANPWAVVAWLGFRIWQGYDVWSYANRMSNIYALPTHNGVVVGYSF